jgi:hypothetical protein
MPQDARSEEVKHHDGGDQRRHRGEAQCESVVKDETKIRDPPADQRMPDDRDEGEGEIRANGTISRSPCDPRKENVGHDRDDARHNHSSCHEPKLVAGSAARDAPLKDEECRGGRPTRYDE